MLDILTVHDPTDAFQIYSLFIIFLWVLNGIFMARDFIRFQRACELHKLNDVDVFLNPRDVSYPDDVKKAVRRAWKSLVVWCVVTVVLFL